jgi:hypothetical protein
MTGLVMDRLLGCMGQVLEQVSGKVRSKGWDKGDEDQD